MATVSTVQNRTNLIQKGQVTLSLVAIAGIVLGVVKRIPLASGAGGVVFIATLILPKLYKERETLIRCLRATADCLSLTTSEPESSGSDRTWKEAFTILAEQVGRARQEPPSIDQLRDIHRQISQYRGVSPELAKLVADLEAIINNQSTPPSPQVDETLAALEANLRGTPTTFDGSDEMA